MGPDQKILAKPGASTHYPYLFTEKTPMRDDVIGIMEKRPGLRERRSVADRVIDKIKTFVETFIDGVD